jgi:hypothetical protein
MAEMIPNSEISANFQTFDSLARAGAQLIWQGFDEYQDKFIDILPYSESKGLPTP